MEFSRLVQIFEAMEQTTKRLKLMEDLGTLFMEVEPSEIKRIVYLIQGIILPSHSGIDLGMGDKLAQQAIAIVSGQSVADIEKAYLKEGDLGNVAGTFLNAKNQRFLGKTPLTIEKVYSNFYRIATSSGPGSQDMKIRLLAELLSNAEPQEGKAIVRFVTGRLRLGVGEATLIDALSFSKTKSKEWREKISRAYNLTSDLGLVAEILFNEGIGAIETITPRPFYPIRPALAERLPTAEDIIAKLGECSVEGKYDGLRLQIHKAGSGKIEIYSRKQERITEMFPDIVAAAELVPAKELIMEGEALAYNEKTGEFASFQETITRKRKHDIAEKAKQLPLRLFAFELLFLDGRDLTGAPYLERQRILKKLVAGNKTIVLAESKVVKTPEELRRLFEDFLKRGLEGIMAKDLKAPYTAGARKFAWIKMKKSYAEGMSDTLDLVIVGYYFGKGKRTEFGFGGLLTAVYDPETERYRTIAKIGTGFSEEQMAAFSELLGKIKLKQKPANVDSLLDADVWVEPKYVVVVKADEITRSPVHTCAMTGKEGLALRFPRIMGFVREDKGPTDATTEAEVLEMFEMQ